MAKYDEMKDQLFADLDEIKDREGEGHAFLVRAARGLAELEKQREADYRAAGIWPPAKA